MLKVAVALEFGVGVLAPGAVGAPVADMEILLEGVAAASEVAAVADIEGSRC